MFHDWTIYSTTAFWPEHLLVQFCAIPPHVLSSDTRENRPAPPSLVSLHRKLWRAMRLPLSFVFSKLDKPTCPQVLLTGYAFQPHYQLCCPPLAAIKQGFKQLVWNSPELCSPMQIASLFCVFCPNSQQGGASQSGPFWRMQCFCYTASVRTSFPKLIVDILELSGAMEMMREFLVIALPHECFPYYERLPWFDVLARVVQIRTLFFSMMGTSCHSSVWKYCRD